MNSFKLFIITIILSQINYLKADCKDKCFIRNLNYPNEFLSRSNDIYINKFFGSFVYSLNLSMIENIKMATWRIETNHKNVSFIQNYLGQFLCGSDAIQQVSSKRIIYVSNVKDDNCAWKIDFYDFKSINKENVYLIWNVKYNQLLFASNDENYYKSNLYLYDNSKKFNSKNFKWAIKCQ